MFTAAELAEHQADAEDRMLDTCRVTRPADVDPDERVMDPDSLAYVDPAPVVVYEGKCRIPRRVGGSAQNADAAEAAWLVDEFPLALPVTGEGYVDGELVAIGNTVTYLTAVDATIAGRVFGITGVSHQTESVERRFRMKQVVGT